MDFRLIASAAFAVLVSSCSSVYDTSEFMARGGAAGSPATSAETAGDTPTPTEVAAAPTPTDVTAAPEKPDEPAAADAGAAADAKPATDAPSPTAPAAVATASVVPARGLLSMFRAPAAPNPAAAVTEAAISGEEAAKAAAPEVAPSPAEAAIPTEDVPPDEISEAELAGEVEADPDEIAVPEAPDDGLEHDFVNVYTSKPDAPVEMIEGLPGVTWEGNMVLASRGDIGDPGNAGSLFGGGDHPFARSVPGIPRKVVQAANGLLLAHSAINVGCVKSDLLSLVRRAESHFGKKVVVTSGYRSPAHNRRVRGAKHSQHMFCNALDLYMPGVARDDLARFFFAQPDRGGIGLYCHTRSIHIDTGKRRQWRWSCRKRG